MPRVVAFSDAKAGQFRANGDSLRTPFLTASANTPDMPVAFLSQGDPGRIIRPHFHVVDQFQIIAEGRGRLGRHDVAPFCVHFSRAYTPYGPLVGDSGTGLSFFTLRARFDPGAEFFPESKDRLRQVSGRQPWQISRRVMMSAASSGTGNHGVNLSAIEGMRDDRGLFACTLTLPPDGEFTAPDPSYGDGQYLVVVHGSIWHDGREHNAFTVAFVEPQEGAFHLRAGSRGAAILILNFPVTTARTAPMTSPAPADSSRTWHCALCAFFYDEAKGLPDDGISPGTRWEDIPDSWTCPDCSAGKQDFRMAERSPAMS